MVKFDYKYLPISDMKVNTTEDPKTGKQRVESVMVHDEPIEPTERFWTSLFARYSFNKAFFRYFDHSEVFDRISEKESQDRMRVCIERDDTHGSKLLAVSNPTKPVVVHDELIELLERYDGENITYANGIVESTHKPRVGNNFDVAGDMFSHRFLMSTSIDGYGQPNIYLSLLRMICSNGMIGYSKDFRSTLALGKGEDDVTHNLTRALDGFNNDEGFAVMRQRMESATTSWASVYESNSLYHLLTRLHNGRKIHVDDPTLLAAPACAEHLNADGGKSEVGTPLVKAFHSMTGDTTHLYGLANLDALSIKRQRTLPVRCTVYDAINFATEVATHYADPEGARQLNAWVGGVVSNEYDMEGTKDKFGDFADFHMEKKIAVPELTGSN
jgi:hypothetical protein